MTQKKRTSRMLSEVHEMARGLHRAGVISKRRMGEFDVLCGVAAPPPMPPERIRQLREQVRLSQAVFASVLGTSVSTVQKWEAGAKRPSGPSLKLLDLIGRKGLEAVL